MREYEFGVLHPDYSASQKLRYYACASVADHVRPVDIHLTYGDLRDLLDLIDAKFEQGPWRYEIHNKQGRLKVTVNCPVRGPERLILNQSPGATIYRKEAEHPWQRVAIYREISGGEA